MIHGEFLMACFAMLSAIPGNFCTVPHLIGTPARGVGAKTMTLILKREKLFATIILCTRAYRVVRAFCSSLASLPKYGVE